MNNKGSKLYPLACYNRSKWELAKGEIVKFNWVSPSLPPHPGAYQ